MNEGKSTTLQPHLELQPPHYSHKNASLAKQRATSLSDLLSLSQRAEPMYFSVSMHLSQKVI